jgi:hypothetical protein
MTVTPRRNTVAAVLATTGQRVAFGMGSIAAVHRLSAVAKIVPARLRGRGGVLGDRDRRWVVLGRRRRVVP